MTQFLARCHKLLKHEHGMRFVVSYSDAHQNGMVVIPKPGSTPWQSGGIYRAANFIHLGKVRPEHHYQDADGEFVHRRVPYRWMKRRIASGRPTTMKQAVRRLGLTPWVAPPKER